MKRLVTLHALIAALSLISLKASAWGGLYLLNSIDNYWDKTGTAKTERKFTEVSANEFTYTLDASDVSSDIYWAISTPGDHNGTYKIHPNTQSEVGENGYNALYNDESDVASFIIKHSTNTYTKYKITATYRQDGEEWHWVVKVESSGEKATSLTEDASIGLKGSFSNDNWGTLKKYTSFDNGIYTWEFTPSEFPDGTEFKMVRETDTWYGAPSTGWGDSDSKQVDEDWRIMSSVDGENMTVSYDESSMKKITIQAKNVGGFYQIRLYYTTETHDYYWVSPQVTNNQKLETFKMVASRNRSGSYGDGNISTRYYSLTIKADDLRNYAGTALAKGDNVEWYIVRDDNQAWFRPSSNTPTPSAVSETLNVGSGDNNVGYRNFENCKTLDSSAEGLFSFLKGYAGYDTQSSTALSYTFILNSQRSSNANQGNVYFNYAKAGASTTTDYYLIGNFNSASETESIDINDRSHPMTKYWYKDGAGSTTEVALADSIVYKIDVQKPEAGWGNLYLDVNPSGNTDWGKVYRPLISLGNTLDGRALVGGVTTAGAAIDNSTGDQSLNPETTDNYTGYTFSFNATTYTYRLEFHTSLYLVGEGVSASESEGSWDISNVSSSDPRIRLNATQEAGHYRNRVYFTQGKQFRFIRNTDEANATYQTTWHENANAPKFSSATTDSEYTPGNETQYKNMLAFQNGNGSSGSTIPSETSVTFDLSTGWYYINFYENAGGTPYYIIEKQIDLRDFNEVHYNNSASGGTIDEDRNILYRNGYNFFRVWSDHIAWTKPDDIDVFVVTQFTVAADGQATVVLTKQTGDYIPAKTGVILASKETKDLFHSGIVYNKAVSGTEYNTASMDMTPADAPATTYSGGDSKLTPLYEATNLQRFVEEGGTEYANYLFGFYRLNKVMKNYDGPNNDFGLGFWLTTGVGNTYANSAFLRILKSDALKMGVGTTYNMDPSGDNNAPAFYLVFEEAPVEQTVTGIADADRQHVAPEGWFTLSGMRVDGPTAKGVYIHNGKKVIR